MPQLENEYIKTGKIKYVFRDLPLEAIHKNAFKAAEAASCAYEQGKFWEMHDSLFANQATLSPANLSIYAETIGLDITKFKQCLDSGKYAAEIRKSIAEAGEAGITGTPTFLLGFTEPNSSKVKVLKVLRGAQPYAAFKDAIDAALSTKKQ